MTSNGDYLRPGAIKPGDLILHFVGDEEEVHFIVMSYVDTILIAGEEHAMVIESLMSITPYKDFLN